MSDSVVLQVEGLGFAYPGVEVFRQWSMAAPAGPVLVRGDESSGKTTLLRLLAGELTAQHGSMLLHGEPLGVAHSESVFWAEARSADLDNAVAREWLDCQRPRYPRWDDAALSAHVEGFALAPHMDKPFFALSTGSRRKVLMAGALACGAALTLIDEPVSGLDKPSTAYLCQALAEAALLPERVVLVAHYEALPGVPWAAVVPLPR
jgi:ABC-type transport system involved in cytochrome c biogenesis ATPase subunit